MRWSFEKYRLWVINSTANPCLFHWENWKRLLPAVDILIHLTTEQAYIRTLQSYERENRWLGFGRMKWNEHNNHLWATKYRDKLEKQKELNFHSTEIWAPDWNSVYNSSRPPDVYIHLYHFPEIARIREGLIIALPKSIYKKNMAIVDSVLQTLAAGIPGSTVTAITRFWQPMWRIRNRIEDMNPHELLEIVEMT